MLTRKIERANIQQGFALDAALRLAKRYDEPRILALGSYEDTAVASLVALGWRIEQADPQVNGMQLEDFYRAPGAGGQYDMILCVSVLEHVPDDETFVRQAAELLAPGGVAIFTVDYNNTFPEHGKMPQADRRLYTTHDLRHRLMGVLPDCALLDPPRWDEGVEDFDYEDCRYAFASWVWEKLPPGVAGAARSAVEALGGPPWKALLSAAVETRHAAEAELEIAEERLREARAELAALELAEWQRNDALRREMERQAAEAVATAAEAARAAQAAAAAALLAPTPRQRLRRLAIQVYSKLLRPFVRPVAWRLRGFMTGGVSNQIQALRHEVAAMRSSGVANPAMLPPGMAQGHNPLPAQDPAMIRATEDALLTIALRGGKG